MRERIKPRKKKTGQSLFLSVSLRAKFWTRIVEIRRNGSSCWNAFCFNVNLYLLCQCQHFERSYSLKLITYLQAHKLWNEKYKYWPMILVHGEYCDTISGSYRGVKVAIQFLAYARNHWFPWFSRNEIRLAKVGSADKLLYQVQRLSLYETEFNGESKDLWQTQVISDLFFKIWFVKMHTTSRKLIEEWRPSSTYSWYRY